MSDQKNQNAPKLVTELKVSANLMTLDAGLFCIFNTPGSAVPDAATGLPGVRVSLPPGPAFRPEAVTITAFRDDGWLGGWNGAALVRVTRGPAQILVTSYQAPNSTADAPKLQILRLADSGALPQLGGQPAAPQPPRPAVAGPAPAAASHPPAAQAAAAAPMSRPAGPGSAALPQNTPAGAAQSDAEAARSAEVVAHVQNRGDVVTKLGEWMGQPDSKAWIEGFAVSPKGAVGPADIEYQAVLGRGWLSPWAEGGQYCGSRGMSLPILGLRMRLRGEAAERFDCVVEASFVDGTKVGPLDNGEPCQAESMSPLEAFNIRLVARGAAEAPGAAAARPADGKATKAPAAKPARGVAAQAQPAAPPDKAVRPAQPAASKTGSPKPGNSPKPGPAKPGPAAKAPPAGQPAKPGRGKR